jgi:hypothetical protein
MQPDADRGDGIVGRRLEMAQGLYEPVDAIAVVVGVEGDPQPACSTAADDPGLRSESSRSYPRIVVGVAQGNDVGRRRWIARRPEGEPSQLGGPFHEVRRQMLRMLVDALEPQRREHRDHGELSYRRVKEIVTASLRLLSAAGPDSGRTPPRVRAPVLSIRIG